MFIKPGHQLVTLTIGFTLFSTLSPLAVSADSAQSAPAVAVAQLTQQQALELVKTALSIDDSYKLQNVSSNDNSSSNSVNLPSSPNMHKVTWTFSWTKGDSTITTNLNASVDAITGSIYSIYRSYNQPLPADGSSSPITADAAKAAAQAWIAKLAPDKVQYIDQGTENQPVGLNPNVSQNFMFKFNRLVNGIPVRSDGFNISISSHGDLMNYSYSWLLADAQFPAVSKAVYSADAAASKYALLPLSLQYIQQFPQYAGGPVSHLVYSTPAPAGSIGSLPLVDATTGALLDNDGNPISAAVPYAPIAATPGAPLVNGPLTSKDDAVALARKLLNLDNSYTVTNSSYNSPGDTTKADPTWNFTFTPSAAPADKSAQVQSLSVNIDANTGELINYWRNTVQPQSTNATSQAPVISSDQAVQIAKTFVAKVAPTRVANLVYSTVSQQVYYPGKMPVSSDYMIHFNGLVNGIPVQFQSINVSVSQTTGNVDNYNANQNVTTSDFPNPAGAVSLKTAQADYVKQYPLTLQYVLVPVKDPTTGQLTWPPTSPRLVYAPEVPANGPQVLDALTGQFISPFSNQPTHQNVTDIKGHWAETQLQDFADRGIIEVKNGKVNPDQLLTRSQAVHLLVLALHNPFVAKAASASSPFFDVYAGSSQASDIEAAVMAGWIDQDMKNFRPDDIITREELADFAVRIIGYSKLASKTSWFKNPYTDIDQNDQYVGDIAIASALGIMGGGGGDTFSPLDQASLASVVVVADRVAKLQLNTPTYRPY
ncbi:MAG: hypothetical protein JWN30_166 [Bacilli bacterium]|nr:hypothetical protein [Bacilli bacterium]